MNKNLESITRKYPIPFIHHLGCLKTWTSEDFLSYFRDIHEIIRRGCDDLLMNLKKPSFKNYILVYEGIEQFVFLINDAEAIYSGLRASQCRDIYKKIFSIELSEEEFHNFLGKIKCEIDWAEGMLKWQMTHEFYATFESKIYYLYQEFFKRFYNEVLDLIDKEPEEQ